MASNFCYQVILRLDTPCTEKEKILTCALNSTMPEVVERNLTPRQQSHPKPEN